MKRLLLILTLAIFTAWTAASAKDWEFPPELDKLIKIYGKTEEPKLPAPDWVDQLEDNYSTAPGKMKMTRNLIINKRKMRLYVVNAFGDTLAHYPVCASANRGQKRGKDDMRTPEGTFTIAGVYNSTDWRYKGTGAKCYGPFFISVNTPGFYGIGVHGTNAPGSVPGRRSHGCIRMHNEDIVVVRKLVDKDSKIIILPDDETEAKKKDKEIRDSYVGPQTKKKETAKPGKTVVKEKAGKDSTRKSSKTTAKASTRSPQKESKTKSKK